MIKGIDAQIMLGRVTDFSKDASYLIKRGEASQEFFAKLTEAKVNKDLYNIADVEKTETENRVRERQEREQNQSEHENNHKHQEKTMNEILDEEIEGVNVGYKEINLVDLEV